MEAAAAEAAAEQAAVAAVVEAAEAAARAEAEADTAAVGAGTSCSPLDVTNHLDAHFCCVTWHLMTQSNKCTCPESAARVAEEAEVAERVAAAGVAAAAEEAKEEAAAYAAYEEALAAEAAAEETEEEAAAAAAEAKAMDELRKKLSADTLAKAKKRAEVFGQEYNLVKKEDADGGRG
jgi:hypothetical protein